MVQILLRSPKNMLSDLRWVEMDVASQESVEDAIKKILSQKTVVWMLLSTMPATWSSVRLKRSHQSSLPNSTMSTF